MVAQINIPDELAAEAQARGLRPEALAEEILQNEANARPRTVAAAHRTPEEIRRWLDCLAQLSDKIPPMPDVITREWIYQDHD
ncbi:MAG: hypothetical protein ABSD20_08890 [Terriglobales bacterium]